LNRGEWAFDLVVKIINTRRGRRSAVDLPPESGEDTAMSLEPSFSQAVVLQRTVPRFSLLRPWLPTIVTITLEMLFLALTFFFVHRPDNGNLSPPFDYSLRGKDD
jgi:hypothetical protein